MGEYFTVRDPDEPYGYRTLCKAGTLDDWRYVRHSECLDWLPHDAGENTNIGAIIEDPTTIYRFPWPDEDGQKRNWDKINERDMFRTLYFVYVGSDYEHRDLVQRVQPGKASPGYGINVWLPCPVGGDFKLRHSTNGPAHVVQIVGERIDKSGQARTIFACAWCGAMFSIAQDELERVREAIRARGVRRGQDCIDTWYDEVAAQIKPNPVSF